MFKTIKYATKIAKNKSQELTLYKKNFHDEKTHTITTLYK